MLLKLKKYWVWFFLVVVALLVTTLIRTFKLRKDENINERSFLSLYFDLLLRKFQ